ncbi:hypothetical protein SAMN05444972_103194 [Marininema halotolerans]|uniref:Uncharacterized protein n=1 Tax=Marininema halotolerans TaxID=1155944 RepID=A0A1I6QJS4_9BACL|nr:hypothetical protein SAMN05444972_103194 [Marininema halotolerans]
MVYQGAVRILGVRITDVRTMVPMVSGTVVKVGRMVAESEPRDTLADAKRISMKDGLYTPEIKKALSKVIKQNLEEWDY